MGRGRAVADLSDRTQIVVGDFFESVPPGGLLLLKFILHDWSDNQCLPILRNCRASLAPGGRIAVMELIVRKQNPFAALNDLNTLCPSAWVRAHAVHHTPTPQSVIEVGAAQPSMRKEWNPPTAGTPFVGT